jgi:putative OPT family oligopeptide transporter
VLIIGIVIASVCGYMAGLIGASNSQCRARGSSRPWASRCCWRRSSGGHRSGGDQALVAFRLFVTAIVFGVATISNDNLQDLKTGELVGATPWRQQVALVLGVVFGALVIPPVLSLLNARFGFVGVPGAGPMRWPRLRRR